MTPEAVDAVASSFLGTYSAFGAPQKGKKDQNEPQAPVKSSLALILQITKGKAQHKTPLQSHILSAKGLRRWSRFVC